MWDVLRSARSRKAAVYHFHDPELIPVGLLLKLGRRAVFYDVHEDLPRQLLHKRWVAPWLRAPVARLVEALEWIAGRVLDGVIAATPAIAERFPGARTVTVQNFPLRDELAPQESTSSSYESRPPNVVYVGGLQSERGLLEMVDAIDRLPESSGARLQLAGEFYPAALADSVRVRPGWRRVDFLGWRSRAEVAALFGAARVGLVLFHPLPNHVRAQPNKLFEYMSAGLPIVASDFPLWREIVDGTGCGLVVDPMNAAEIAEAVRRILEHPAEAAAMGARGRAAVEDRYNWSREAGKLVDFYAQRLA